jgi:hypothetical protein
MVGGKQVLTASSRETVMNTILEEKIENLEVNAETASEIDYSDIPSQTSQTDNDLQQIMDDVQEVSELINQTIENSSDTIDQTLEQNASPEISTANPLPEVSDDAEAINDILKSVESLTQEVTQAETIDPSAFDEAIIDSLSDAPTEASIV